MRTWVALQPACARTLTKLKTFAPVHHVRDQFQQTARLRRQVVERTAHQLAHEPVRRRYVCSRHFDVRHAALGLDGAGAGAGARSNG